NADSVFVHLMYGENFEDELNRDKVAGQNGVGVSLVRIVSSFFKVITASKGKSFSKLFTVHPAFTDALKKSKLKKELQHKLVAYFEEHGHIEGADFIKPALQKKLKTVMKQTLMISSQKKSKGHGTKVVFELDSRYFNKLDVSFKVKLVRQYLQDIAMTNPGLKVYFKYKNKEEVFHFQKGLEDVFRQSKLDFYKMRYENKQNGLLLESYFVAGQGKNLTWVNSNFASLGGSPVEYLANRVCDEVRKRASITALEKKLKTSSTRNDVRNCFHIYNDFKVLNPRFKSQDKSYLINNFNEDIREAVDQYLDRIIRKLDLLNNVKNQMEKRTTLRAMDDAQKKLRKASKNNIPKLIPPSTRPGSGERILFIAEGDSAIAGLRPVRNPRIHGLFPLRGKPLNVKGMSLARAMKNKEINNIIAILGLPMQGKVKSLRDLNYSRVSVITDADFDGYAIRSLMLSFFYEYWPELYKMGFVTISSAPLYEVEIENSRKEKRIFFCTADKDYDVLMQKVKKSGSKVIRKKRNKGLGETGKEAMQHAVDNCMTTITITNAKQAANTQKLWFHKDFAEARRKTISEYAQLFFDD
ncbi:MAG TPA: toprim domain-containing protein, partial [Spirochaetota bacterium]|nr:toprim domain-containing protein [Spirochaetota bacterium]